MLQSGKRIAIDPSRFSARKAAEQTDPKAKQDFLDLERRWLSLARSFEFSELVTGFKPADPEPAPGG